MDNPRISFLIPFRWFNEDRKFLADNLKRQITFRLGSFDNADDELERLKRILSYSIVLNYQANKPVDISLSKTEAQKALKGIFANAKCLGVEVVYQYHKSKTMLPLVDFRLFF